MQILFLQADWKDDGIRKVKKSFTRRKVFLWRTWKPWRIGKGWGSIRTSEL